MPGCRTFACKRFDSGEELLRADYSINCETRRHFHYTLYACLMILVYVSPNPHP